jgi:hypothetical protein
LRWLDDVIYHEPSDVSAQDGCVELEGPDGVDVALTPEAAEETADRMVDQSVMARGQRYLKKLPNRPK